MATEYNNVKSSATVANTVEPREDIKRVTQVTTARPVKKGIFSRMGNALFGPDGIRAIGSYIGREIVVPAIKNIIVDGFTTGINRAVYGEDDRRRPRHSSQPGYTYGGYTQYNNSYKGGQNSTVNGRGYNENVRASNRLIEYAIVDYSEALDALDQIKELASKYGEVSVAEYYSTIGVKVESTDYDYGWTYEDVSRVGLVSANGGWVFNLPRPRSLR